MPETRTAAGGKGRASYGDHLWAPEVLADFSKGMVRDTARVAIPDGSVYDSSDYLLDQPGVARKRGGTSYLGGALSGSSYCVQITANRLDAGGGGVCVIGSNSHLYAVTAAGAVTDVGALSTLNYGQLAWSPGYTYLVIGNYGGQWQKYNGSAISNLDGTGFSFHMATYKARVMAASDTRLFFSPVPDVNAAWDTANSWIDTDNRISGMAALNNALLIFSSDHMERIIGATPPPNTDMDRAPLANVGCTDCRSIVIESPYVYFANPEGVWLTNGSTPVSLTDQGGISNYWRDLFSGYVTAAPVPGPGTWTIAAGFWRGFLFVSVLNASRVLQTCLMCHVTRRAWWRLTNVKAACWVTALDGNELYYGDASTNRVVKVSSLFAPAAANKLDADGTAVTPAIEFRPVGQGVGTKAYAWGHVNFDMRDAAGDNPTMGVTVKTGIEADTSYTPPESPLVETSTLVRPRFTINRSAQAATVSLSQNGPSAKTEVYALEVQHRPDPLTGEGVS